MVHSITLQTFDGTITDNDILGQISFAAPNETGTDAISIAASIFARSEGTFAADNNATELVFVTGTTESAAPGATNYDMTLSSAGLLTLAGNLVIPSAGNIGSAGDADAIAIASDGVVTMNQIPVFSAGINVSGGTIAGTIATATQNSITTMTGLVTTGALDSGSITSGFGTIDTGSSTLGCGAITTIGTTKVGASAGSGQDFYAYTAGAAAHVGLHWDADGNTEGTLIGGADDHGVDFKFFGETAGSYVQWDQSADDLIVRVGDIIVQDASGNTEIAMDSSGTLVLGTNGDRQIRVDNSASGTNVAGSNLQLRAGKGTGSGVGGPIRFYTSPAGGSGSGSNNHAIAVEIGGNGETTFNKSVNQAPNTATDGGAVDIDCGASNYHEILMNADATSVVFTNATAGQRVVVRFKQHSSHIDMHATAGWNTVTVNGSSATVTWPGGTIPTLTETNNAIDVYGFIFQNTVTNVHAFIIGQALA